MIARRVVVSGQVQGVFFRDRTRHEAHRLGVAGWVRNRADGTVEAHFEGPAEAVAEIVRWCRTGPPYARVHGVRVGDAEPQGLVGFRIG